MSLHTARRVYKGYCSSLLLIILFSYSQLTMAEQKTTPFDTNQNNIDLSTYVSTTNFSSGAPRNRLTIESLLLTINKGPTQWYRFQFNNEVTVYPTSTEDFHLDDRRFAVSAYKAFDLSDELLIGFRGDHTYLKSDDPVSNTTLVPYVSLIIDPKAISQRFDTGFAYSQYRLNSTRFVSAKQYTLTIMQPLFSKKGEASVRFYLIEVDSPFVSSISKTYFSAVLRFQYNVIPDRLTFNLYGLVGQQRLAYNIRLMEINDGFDLEKGSFGATVTFHLKNRLKLFTDITHTEYNALSTHRDYHTNWYTVGLEISS